MAARLLRAFDLASSDSREQVIIGIAERLGDDELRCFQNALRRLEHRFDVLCGASRVSGARLPHEIQLQIVDLLEITDIYYCTNVCRQWRRLLLECRQLTDDLFKKYFSAHFDDMRDKSDLLHQAIRRRHLRDSGRFRTRFTCGFLKNADGTLAVDRVEGLQRGQIFKDLTCSGSLYLQTQYPGRSTSNSSSRASTTSLDDSGNVVSRYLYSDGRLAWQLMPAPGEWAHSIIVHDFHAHRRWGLSLPSMRTRGIKLVLWALGDDLVVARVVGERVLYAWDLSSRAVDRVTLQNLPTKCFTRHHSVVIVSQSGELLLWSFGHGLEDIDTAMLQDEDEDERSAQWKQTLKRPLPDHFELHKLTVMFHPRDEDVFFLAIFDDRNLNPDELWVCEFRDKRCCRKFAYSVPPGRRLSVVFEAQMIDAHGTYQLLEHETQIGNGIQLSGVTFNTISKSFGASRFQVPCNIDADKCLVWNGQLVLRYFDPEASPIQPWPLLVLGPQPGRGDLKAIQDAPLEEQLLEKAMEGVMESAASLEIFNSNVVPSRRIRAVIEALEQGKPKYDIIRALGVPYSTSDLCTTIGLRYILSFSGGQCNWEGDHVRNCPGTSGLSKPSARAVAILGDDGFLVIVNQTCYTVFAVDENGEMAEALRGTAMVGTEEASYKPL